MKHIFLESVTQGASWREDFWFSSMLRPVDGQLTIAAYGESNVFNGCDFHHLEKVGYCYLELIVRGSGTLTYSDGSRYRLTPGTLYMLSPERGSRISVPPGGELVKTVVGLLNGALLQLMLRNSLLDAGDAIKLPADSRYPEQLKKIGEMIRNAPDADDLSAECYRLLLSIASHHGEYTENNQLQAVCEYMQSQLSEQINLEDLARAAKSSPVTLIRNFRARFGCTPVQYLINLRMNYARTLLRLRQIPVKDVAKLCGYRNAKFFSREYRKKFGRPPSQEERTIR